MQAVDGGEEVATRMTVGIGMEVAGVTLVGVVTGTLIEGLVVGPKPPSVAVRLKIVATT